MSDYKFRANQALTSKQFWRALVCDAELILALDPDHVGFEEIA
jgi:hypothetical protein